MGRNAQRQAQDGFLTWAETAPWQRDNEFIVTGYRRASFSCITSIWSIMTIHNETANIWSHLLGALLFASLSAHFFILSHLADGVRAEDGVALGVYYMAVVACFVLSTSFHTFSDHSPEIHKLGNELDHLGIVFVMWGTGVSLAHFAFYCHPAVRDVYLAMLTATAVGCGVFTLQPKIRQPSYRLVRFIMYALLGASLFTPVAQGLHRFGWQGLDEMAGLGSFFGLAAVNFSGSAVYAMRVPERWFPGRFDLLGQSHNWMHLLVVTGALIRLNGLVQVVGRWQAYNGASLDGFCARLE